MIYFLGCLALAFPRMVILLLVIFSDYIGRAYDTVLWPVLGFLAMPCTTLAYAVAKNQGGGLQGWYIALFVLGIMIDVGFFSEGEKRTRRLRNGPKP
jgi:hypothetical protein